MNTFTHVFFHVYVHLCASISAQSLHRMDQRLDEDIKLAGRNFVELKFHESVSAILKKEGLDNEKKLNELLELDDAMIFDILKLYGIPPSDMVTCMRQLLDYKASRRSLKHNSQEFIVPWLNIPIKKLFVVNIFSNMFFERCPTTEEIKDVLNTMGLLSALLLSVAIAFPTCLDYDELQDYGQRYEHCDEDVVFWFGLNVWQALTLNCGALIISVLLLFFLSTIEFNDIDELKRWWIWARYPIMLGMVYLVAGSYCTQTSLYHLMRLKWPLRNDRYYEDCTVSLDHVSELYQRTWALGSTISYLAVGFCIVGVSVGMMSGVAL